LTTPRPVRSAICKYEFEPLKAIASDSWPDVTKETDDELLDRELGPESVNIELLSKL